MRRLATILFAALWGFGCSSNTAGPDDTPSTPMFAVTQGPAPAATSSSSWRGVLMDSMGVVVDSVVGLPDGCSCPLTWSPDGQSILFADEFGVALIVVDVTTGTRRSISVSPLANAYWPAWSPDGSRIAFTAFGRDPTRVDGWFDVYLIDVDGANLTRLTDSPGGDWRPTWSHDGTQIAFVTSRKQTDTNQYPYPYMDIWVMQADGSGEHPITDDMVYDDGPHWSPDGSKISFVRATSGGALQVHTMRPDGAELTIVPMPFGIFYAFGGAAWSPDGTRFAFSARDPSDTTGASGKYEIYVARVDGSDVTRLTDNDVDDVFVSWKPPTQ